MIGALDETGKLKYGQVFVQYSKDLKRPKAQKSIHRGHVVVSKCPALHPGDIRKFKAVDIPDLHHMVDCIVFPQRGKRPHPDEMAGSDLDGDEYFVTWLPQLIFERRNVTPMDFNPPPKIVHIGPIDNTDMSHYVAEYIKNDKLGVIANAHCAQADRCSIFDQVCLEIAAIHSQTVDFAKTGNAQDLDRNQRPYIYPDFMGKTDKCSYRSDKVLGVMFRQCRRITRMITEHVHEKDKAICPDTLFSYPNWQFYESDALSMRDNYNRRLENILSQYGVESESEAFSGCIRKFSKKYTQSNEIFDVKLLIGERIKNLTKETRQRFFEEFGGEQDVTSYSSDMLTKASAWYTVTYQQEKAPYLSFPWVVNDLLLSICSRKQQSLVPQCYIMQDLSTEAEKYISESKDEKIRDVISADICQSHLKRRLTQKILEHLQDKGNVLRSAAGFLLKWQRNNNIDISRTKLLFLLYEFVGKESIFRSVNGSRTMTPSLKSSKGEKWNAGECLVEFFSFCASLEFRNNGYPSAQTQELIMYERERSTLSQNAETAYQKIAVFGSLNAILDRPQGGITELTKKVNFKVYNTQTHLKRCCAKSHPDVQISFRVVNSNAKKSDANVTIRGPVSDAYAVQDLLTEWTGNIPTIPTEFDRHDLEYEGYDSEEENNDTEYEYDDSELQETDSEYERDDSEEGNSDTEYESDDLEFEESDLDYEGTDSECEKSDSEYEENDPECKGSDSEYGGHSSECDKSDSEYEGSDPSSYEGCYNCGLQNHNLETCKYSSRVRCHACNALVIRNVIVGFEKLATIDDRIKALRGHNWMLLAQRP